MSTLRQSIQRATRGFTLIEMMVALIITLLVLVATVSFYLMTRSTYTTIDDSSNLEERGQFALGVITRALRQTSFAAPSLTGVGVFQPSPSDPPTVSGVDNCSAPPAGESLSACGSTPTPVNASDAIELRFYGSGTASDPTIPDNSMVDCSGQGVASPTSIGTAGTERGLSIFFVQTINGVPSLMCKTRKRDASGKELNNTTTETDYNTQALVPGVETLQFLYGVSNDNDAIPNVYKRASDMTASDWQNVYAVKIAMVIRADNASADVSAVAPTFQLFGSQYTNTDGSYKPTQNLGSARKLFTTTVQTRNYATCFQGDPTCI